MKARIIKIGNSRGIRIPKPLLEQTGLGEEVEIHIEDDRLVVALAEPVSGRPRANWSKTFKEMARTGDDALLDGDVVLPTQWEDDWEWQ
jgi:antitoxin MazE